MIYKIVLKKRADKYLKLLDRKTQIKILEILNKLSRWNIGELDLKLINGVENTYRVRFGKYRLVFEKYEKKLLIVVIKIGSRGDVYK